MAKRVFVQNYWYENMMSPLQSFACDFHDFHGKRFAVVTKTYGTTHNQPKLAKTTQSQPKPRKPSQNDPNPCTIYLITTGLCDTCVDGRCDYHVEIFSTLDIMFHIAIKNFALKLSQKVKVFSLAENKPASPAANVMK